MKRIIIKITKYTMFLLGIVLFVGCLRLPVYADIWVDPMDSDDFIVSHADSCVRMYCTYTANGKGGQVNVYKTPEDHTVVATIQNYISKAYVCYYVNEDGAWCCYTDASGYPVGWVKEKDLILVYNDSAFFRYYGEEIEYSEELKEVTFDVEFIYLYEYPGSPIAKQRQNEEAHSYRGTYKDDNGHIWINCLDVRGWICIDNPTALPQELYPDGLPEMRGASDAAVRTNWTPFIIVASLVTGVAAVTGILLLFIYRKHKSKKNNSEEA